ncbi:MAG: hypothetical protein GY708_03370 [Actinomycetia bacterium]|nr:hypothetical protein [Actinomycetes bacterium]
MCVFITMLAVAACSNDPAIVETVASTPSTTASSSTMTPPPNTSPTAGASSPETALPGRSVWSRSPYEPGELRVSMLALFRGPVRFEEPGCLVVTLDSEGDVSLFMPPNTFYDDDRGVVVVDGHDLVLGDWEIGGGLVEVAATAGISAQRPGDMCADRGQIIVVGDVIPCCSDLF